MDLFKDLQNSTVFCSDGAWGTELAKAGMEIGYCPELLNAEKPDVVKKVAGDYIQAGSQIILTNTFGGSPFKLARYGLQERTFELNKKGTEISREAAGSEVLVFASLGPSGEFLEPYGTLGEKELTEGFAVQAEAFRQGGADCVLVETMSDLRELICALHAVKESTDLPVVCSMTFEKGRNGYATMMGIKPGDAVKKIVEEGAEIPGANCGAGIDQMVEIAAIMHSAVQSPLWIKPNAGMPEIENGKTVFRESPEYMASRVVQLIEAGAGIIGGCCGTTPAHLSAIRKEIDKVNQQQS